MANQDANPPEWNEEQSDGCSLPWFLKWVSRSVRPACLRHDRMYHYGGTVNDKQASDDDFYTYASILGPWYMPMWLREWRASRMYWHIRAWTYNYPPGHPNRSSRDLTKVKAWNWLGSPR